MDIKSLFIVGGAVFLLLNSCGLSSVSQGVQVVTAEVTNMTNVDPNAAMNPACLGAAQEQLSPQWANMSRAQRFAMGLQIVTTCTDGGGH